MTVDSSISHLDFPLTKQPTLEDLIAENKRIEASRQEFQELIDYHQELEQERQIKRQEIQHQDYLRAMAGLDRRMSYGLDSTALSRIFCECSPSRGDYLLPRSWSFTSEALGHDPTPSLKPKKRSIFGILTGS